MRGSSVAAEVPAELTAADGYPDGPEELVVLGPPGCGKTWASLVRFGLPALRAIGLPHRERGEAPGPAEVLMVSFSRAAAGELRERLARELGGEPCDYRGVARTFHSEALRLVRSAGLSCVLPRRAGTEDDEQDGPEDALSSEQALEEGASERLKAAVRVWDLARHRLEREDLRRAYALAQVEGFTLAAIEAEVRAYERSKRTKGIVDFTDVLELALEVAPPERELVLVDEAQDTSLLQWALLERWTGAARRRVAVGDLDQALHVWCGAAPQRLAELARAWAVRRLGQSRRVPRAAHALARRLILLNRGRLDAPYLPADRDGRVEEVQLAAAVERIAAAADAGREVLVLAQNKKALGRWVDGLAAGVVPFLNERGFAPLNGATRRACARAVVGLRAGSAGLGDVKLLLGALPASRFEGTKKDVREEVGAWTGDRVTPDELVGAGVSLDGLLGGSLRDALGRAGRSVAKVAGHLAALVERHGAEVLDREPLVALTTMHGSKGREAPLVVLELQASRRLVGNLGQPGATEAARQLLYVAVTRTSDELLLARHPRRDLGALLGLPSVARCVVHTRARERVSSSGHGQTRHSAVQQHCNVERSSYDGDS